MAKPAAFFDLDKTLMEGSSALHFGRASYRAGLIGRREVAKGAWDNLQFRLKGSTDASTQALWDSILGSIAGTRVKDLERLAPQILAGILPRLYPRMLAIAHEHQDAGRPVYIVTAASNELADMLASVLAFDGGIGMRSEVRDGVYTGRPDGPFTYREGKAQAIREMAAREGIDLDESWAYSDSESDLPMLRAVGHPVVVNPDQELRSVAREEGWQVIHIDKLARRLRFAAAAGAAGLVAAGSGYAAARVRPGTRGPIARLRR
jgi:HAD superfamily hydrolase (TIGR01490 family)